MEINLSHAHFIFYLFDVYTQYGYGSAHSPFSTANVAIFKPIQAMWNVSVLGSIIFINSP